jgi:predicted HicB family RNase H-like nuclease
MNAFAYKNYIGIAHVEAEDKVIAGRVIGMRAMITFEGETVPEAEEAFRGSVDVYLDWCKGRGVAAEKPFSGEITFRVSQETHRKLALIAESRGMTLGEYVANRLLRDELTVAEAVVVRGNGTKKRRPAAG